MEIGHTGQLHFLAFDHRGAFCRDLYGIEGTPDARQTAAIADAKSVVFEGLRRAIVEGSAPSAGAAVLVDEQFGAAVAERARDEGVFLAMPVERSNHQVFDFEYGAAFGEHLARFRPDAAKVLVRHNVEADPAANRLQLGRLKRLENWLRANDVKLLYELLVPATVAQLAAVGGDAERFRRELRPELIRLGMAAAQDVGIEVDIWKLEGVEVAADAERLVEQARSGPGRENVTCVLLGAGAPTDQVEHWLRVAAATDGFSGFAIGRSIWRAPLQDLLAGRSTRGETIGRIADAYVRCVETYTAEEIRR